MLFAWLCAFYVIPEGLAVPYAATFGGGAVTAGLLLAAMPAGMVVGSLLFSRFVRPANRLHVMGWMSMLACLPLIGAGVHPPLWWVVGLWALSGVGAAYQLAANTAFVAAVPRRGGGRRSGSPSPASSPGRAPASSSAVPRRRSSARRRWWRSPGSSACRPPRCSP